ncbi:MAG: PilZ domain-containing protein [Planctomycetes bacterium]|nr:PilZ domain-containing protein [Planctomycetota bacterium]
MRSTILGSDHKRIIVSCESSPGFGMETPITVRYLDPVSHRFLHAEGTVARVVSEQPQFVCEIQLHSAFDYGERRGAYRVHLDAQLAVRGSINERSRLRVVDVSATGLGVVGDLDAAVNDEVSITLSYDDTTAQGSGVIRRCVPLTGNTSRYGIELTDSAPELQLLLIDIAMNQQRRDLQKRNPAQGGTRQQTRRDEEPTPAPLPGEMLLNPSGLIGQTLPGSLVLENGRAVKGRGEILEAQDLKTIDDQEIYLADDWFDLHTDTLPQGAPADKKADAPERRRHERREWRGSVLVEYGPPAGCHTFRTNTIDLSAGGLAIESHINLAPGDGLRIRIKGKSTTHVLHAAVVYCRACSFKSGASYRVGAKLVRATDE